MVVAEAFGQFKVKVLAEKDSDGAWPVVLVAKRTDWRFLLASPATREEAVKVAIFMFPPQETLNRLAPEVEAARKTGRVKLEDEATTSKAAPAGVEVLIKSDLAVLSHKKLEEPAVVVAAE